jgi:hypothetical protein
MLHLRTNNTGTDKKAREKKQLHFITKNGGKFSP